MTSAARHLIRCAASVADCLFDKSEEKWIQAYRSLFEKHSMRNRESAASGDLAGLRQQLIYGCSSDRIVFVSHVESATDFARNNVCCTRLCFDDTHGSDKFYFG